MKIYSIEFGYEGQILGYYSTIEKAEIALSELVAQSMRPDLYDITEIEVD